MLVDIARRGLSHPNTVAYVKRGLAAQGEGVEVPEMPFWGGVLIYVTAMIAMVGITLVSYMLNEVISTLCMVESPAAAITVSPSTHDVSLDAKTKSETEGLLEAGPTITLVNQKPITSSIRGTIAHLVAHAGRWARFRGFRIHLLHSFLFSMSTTFFSAALPPFPGQIIVVAALGGAAVANVHAAWTHKVVSMPSSQSFWQRLPGTAAWKTLAGPAAIQAAMPYVSLHLIGGMGMLLGLHKVMMQPDAPSCDFSIMARLAALFVFAIACTLFLCLPAIVTLARIEASILSEDQDTIVPFDRTFGGKVVSQLMGGTGKVGFLDAWRSFNWEARRRLMKLIAKSFLIVTGLMFVVVHVLVAEVFVVMGPEMGRFLRNVQDEMRAGNAL